MPKPRLIQNMLRKSGWKPERSRIAVLIAATPLEARAGIEPACEDLQSST